MNHKCVRIVATLLLAVLLLGSAGCTQLLWASNFASLVTGWLAHGLVPPLVSTQLTCYRNGLLVDCGTVPSEMVPATN